MIADDSMMALIVNTAMWEFSRSFWTENNGRADGSKYGTSIFKFCYSSSKWASSSADGVCRLNDSLSQIYETVNDKAKVLF
jgi:hypothetical protein